MAQLQTWLNLYRSFILTGTLCQVTEKLVGEPPTQWRIQEFLKGGAVKQREVRIRYKLNISVENC
jgi:hypothetical protein